MQGSWLRLWDYFLTEKISDLQVSTFKWLHKQTFWEIFHIKTNWLIVSLSNNKTPLKMILPQPNEKALKIVSTTFLLVCFVSLKEGTCETKKNVFYFTSKAIFVLEIIKFELFRYSNVMTSSNAQAWSTKHILRNNLGSKHSLVIKFDQFM